MSWAVPVLRGVCAVGPGRVALGAAVSPEKTFFFQLSFFRFPRAIP